MPRRLISPRRWTPPRLATWCRAATAPSGSLDGRAVHDLRTDDGSYGFVTSVAERDGTLVLGSLIEGDVALLDTPR